MRGSIKSFLLLAAILAIQVMWASATTSFDFDSINLEDMLSEIDNTHFEGPLDAPHRVLIAGENTSPGTYPPPLAYSPTYSPPVYSPPPPVVSPPSPPSPPTVPVVILPNCTNPNGCLFVSPSSGNVLTVFSIYTADWAISKPSNLTYTFGYYDNNGNQIISTSGPLSNANMSISANGTVTVFVCVTSRYSGICTSGTNQVYVTVDVSSTISQSAVNEAINSLQTVTADNALAAANTALSLLTYGSVNASVAASISNSILSNLDPATTSSTVYLSTVSSLWSYSSSTGQSAVVNALNTVFNNLATTTISASTANSILSLMSSMTSSSISGVSSATLTSSFASGLASTSKALLNGATLGGNPIVASSGAIRLFVQRVLASAFANGGNFGISSSHHRSSRRRMLTTAISNSVNVSSAVQAACVADVTCSSNGVGVLMSTFPASTISTTYPAFSYVKGLSNYGGSAVYVSPIFRVGLNGLTYTTPTNGLVNLTILVNSSLIGSTATHGTVVVRMEDNSTYLNGTDPYNTGTVSTTSINVLDITDGYVTATSNMFGDYAVISYALPVANSPPPPSGNINNGASSVLSGSSALPAALLGMAIAFLAL
mmetsp:Transcript_11539/g.20811  ORF Transcript_11539/g.20811 Transcript_11539/m.20811 type:complete len:602 (-) Transcript_11539:1367-3172(-)